MTQPDRRKTGFWGWVQAVNQIGIASVLALIIIQQKDPRVLDARMQGDIDLRTAQHEALMDTMRQQSEVGKETVEALRALSGNLDTKISHMYDATEWLKGLISGKITCAPCRKCPDIPACPELSCAPCPDCIVIPMSKPTPPLPKFDSKPKPQVRRPEIDK